MLITTGEPDEFHQQPPLTTFEVSMKSNPKPLTRAKAFRAR